MYYTLLHIWLRAHTHTLRSPTGPVSPEQDHSALTLFHDTYGYIGVMVNIDSSFDWIWNQMSQAFGNVCGPSFRKD